MQPVSLCRLMFCAVCLIGNICHVSQARADFEIVPNRAKLVGNFAQAQLLVRDLQTASDDSARRADLTRKAVYGSTDPSVVTASPAGRITAVANGQAKVTVIFEGHTRAINVDVTGVETEPQINFVRQIVPILSKAGCNAAACHASQYGKGNFKLSVFGFAPEDDYEAIVRSLQGRRVNLIEPERSLFLLKPTRTIAHGGNRRIDVGSTDYRIIHAWLHAGAPAPTAADPKATAIEVLPRRRVGSQGFEQQLQVVATYSDGQRRDVTSWAKFDSMDESIVQVGPDGFARATGRGQSGVMVRFEGQAEISTLVTPFSPSVNLADWKDQNYIDQLASAKFKELGLTPSPLCDDATFLRRAYLDAIGTLPRLEDTQAFLDSTDPQKRIKLVDKLLGLTGNVNEDVHNNEYAAYWSVKWADLIRSASSALGERGMWAMHTWIRDSLRTNKPFDVFTRELVTAKGSVYRNGPANFYCIAKDPVDMAETASQLFMGVRLQCAKCHHHPYEKYSQEDYYSFAACFANVSTKTSSEFGIFGGEKVVVLRSSDVRHPRTGQVMAPAPLEGEPFQPAPDKRQPLARWLTSQENHYFARNVVNRYVAYFLGQGLVEPVDDLRETNPPSNVALMDTLSQKFIESKFNLKSLIRDIMTSRLYQLDSQPTKENQTDTRFYSHYHVKRIGAEPLLDAIDFATASPTKFDNMPLGTRAIDLPDSNYANYFLKTFGKPRRAIVCECERVSAPNLSQALNTLNGDVIFTKISDSKGRVAQMLARNKTFEESVGELYLASLCRRPSPAEIEAARKFRGMSPAPKAFYEDLLWTLLNSKQFLFVN